MSKRQKLVVLSGAGMSAESGINTFRDAGGLWEGHDVMEVASPQGWRKNKALVLDFYNKRRRQLKEVQPNIGHITLAKAEDWIDITIVTQNVDNLHERAGSKDIIHLHGELTRARSERFTDLSYEWTEDINLNDCCEKGHQLRPDIVWFGEAVPNLEIGAQATSSADYILIVGTSLMVYPAASLYQFASAQAQIFYVDPSPGEIDHLFRDRVHIVPSIASKGIEAVLHQIRSEIQ